MYENIKKTTQRGTVLSISELLHCVVYINICTPFRNNAMQIPGSTFIQLLLASKFELKKKKM